MHRDEVLMRLCEIKPRKVRVRKARRLYETKAPTPRSYSSRQAVMPCLDARRQASLPSPTSQIASQGRNCGSAQRSARDSKQSWVVGGRMNLRIIHEVSSPSTAVPI